MENKKLNIVKIVIVLIVLSYIIISLANLFLTPVNKVNIVQGKISDESSVEGYIVRNETIVSTNQVADVSLLETEGTKVAKGKTIATYVSVNNDNVKKKIDELDTKIQSALQEQTDLYSSDTKKVEKEIENLLQDIINTNDMKVIKQKYSEIHSLHEKKAKISGDLSQSGSYIKQLIEQRNTYEKELNESTDYIKSTISGVVSTRVDGLEDILTKDKIAEISYDKLEEYKLNTDEIIATNAKKIKLVDNYSCYLIAKINTQKYPEKIEEGNEIKVRLNIENLESVNAKIIKIVDEGESKIVALEINKNIEQLIAYRKISFDIIWWEYEGLKVPNSSLIIEGNNVWVSKIKNNTEQKVMVKILKQNNDYAIIDNLTKEEKQALGYTETQISEEISLYDELKIQ